MGRLRALVRKAAILCASTALPLSAQTAAAPAPSRAAPGDSLHLWDVVRAVVVRSPQVRLQALSVDAQRGVVRSASGAFDPTVGLTVSRGRNQTPLSNVAEANLGTNFLTTEVTTWQASVEKTTRWGTTLRPLVEVQRSENRTVTGEPVSNIGRFGLLLVQPLWSERGTTLAAATENAARLDLEAVRLDQRYVTEAEVAGAVVAYWGYLAAHRRLTIVTESEQRARTLVVETEALITADEVAPVERNQLLANRSDRIAARIRSEQDLVRARHELGLTMGLSVEEIVALPAPGFDFPPIPTDSVGAPTDFEALERTLVDIALSRRADVSAEQLRARAIERRVSGLLETGEPDLDLIIEFGYAGLVEGTEFARFFSPLARRRTGLDFTGTLSYDWPVQQNRAGGEIDRQEAVRDQQAIRLADLRRRVRSGVTVALDAVRKSALGLGHAREAVRLYRTAVESEKEKFQLGSSTLLDVINLEDRLRSALLNEVSGEVAYAVALVELRLQSGTLVPAGGSPADITPRDLTAPLDPGTGGPP